jgi:hypothetical protein
LKEQHFELVHEDYLEAETANVALNTYDELRGDQLGDRGEGEHSGEKQDSGSDVGSELKALILVGSEIVEQDEGGVLKDPTNLQKLIRQEVKGVRTVVKVDEDDLEDSGGL